MKKLFYKSLKYIAHFLLVFVASFTEVKIVQAEEFHALAEICQNPMPRAECFQWPTEEQLKKLQKRTPANLTSPLGHPSVPPPGQYNYGYPGFAAGGGAGFTGGAALMYGLPGLGSYPGSGVGAWGPYSFDPMMGYPYRNTGPGITPFYMNMFNRFGQWGTTLDNPKIDRSRSRGKTKRYKKYKRKTRRVRDESPGNPTTKKFNPFKIPPKSPPKADCEGDKCNGIEAVPEEEVTNGTSVEDCKKDPNCSVEPVPPPKTTPKVQTCRDRSKRKCSSGQVPDDDGCCPPAPVEERCTVDGKVTCKNPKDGVCCNPPKKAEPPKKAPPVKTAKCTIPERPCRDNNAECCPANAPILVCEGNTPKRCPDGCCTEEESTPAVTVCENCHKVTPAPKEKITDDGKPVIEKARETTCQPGKTDLFAKIGDVTNAPSKTSKFYGCVKALQQMGLPNDKMLFCKDGKKNPKVTKPCIDDKYTNHVVAAYKEVTKCLGISEEAFFPIVGIESKFRIEAYNKDAKGTSLGITQTYNNSGYKDIYMGKNHNDRVHKPKQWVLKKSKEIAKDCKKLSDKYLIMDKLKRDQKKECSFVSPPDNPIKNFFLGGIIYKKKLASLNTYSSKNTHADINSQCDNDSFASPEDLTRKQLNFLSYHVGSAGAIMEYCNYLKYSKENKISPNKDLMSESKGSFLDFIRTVRLPKKKGGSEYAYDIDDYAKKANRLKESLDGQGCYDVPRGK